eukprot:SAG25_NODE_82_length_16576_cov_27.388602_6_plen_169_part_00
MGDQKWHCWFDRMISSAGSQDSGFAEATLTLTALADKQAVDVALRERGSLTEEEQQASAAACEQLAKDNAEVVITLHPTASLNGTYKYVGTLEGWPYFRSDTDKFLYRYHAAKQQRWFLNMELTPKSSMCLSCIDAPQGLMPTGPNKWFCREGAAWVFAEVSTVVRLR